MAYLSWGSWELEDPEDIVDLTYEGLVALISSDISGLSPSGIGPTIGFMGPACAGKTTLRNEVAKSLEANAKNGKILTISEDFAGYPRREEHDKGAYGKLDVMDFFDPDAETNPRVEGLIREEIERWSGKDPAPHQLCYQTERLHELVNWISTRQPGTKEFAGWYLEKSKQLDFNGSKSINPNDTVLVEGGYLTEAHWYPQNFFSQLYLLLVGNEVYVDRALDREAKDQTQDVGKREMFENYDRIVKNPTMEKFYSRFRDWINSGRVHRVIDMRDFSKPKELIYKAQTS